MLTLAQGSKKIIFVVFIFFVISLILSFFFIPFIFLSILFLATLCFIIYFFRDPDRKAPIDKDLILSPADGSIFDILYSKEYTRLRIRMSLFNVHVNRAPLSGKITSISRNRGHHWPFFPFLKHGADKNAHQVIQIQTKDFILDVIQISGMIARRCVCFHKVGDIIRQGQRLGIIRLGSEVDLVFPTKIRIEFLVKNGEKIKAGETPVAKIIEVID